MTTAAEEASGMAANVRAIAGEACSKTQPRATNSCPARYRLYSHQTAIFVYNIQACKGNNSLLLLLMDGTHQ